MQILTDLSEIVNNGGPSIAPAVYTASTQGASVNMQNDEVLTGALVNFGAVGAGLTTAQIQIEEWNGTTAGGSTWTAIPNQTSFINGAAFTGVTQVTTGALLSIIGLRTQGFARINAITMSGTTVSYAAAGTLLGMPKSSASATGYSRSPSV